MHRSKRGDSIAEHAVAKAVRYARVQQTLAVCNSEGEAVPCRSSEMSSGQGHHHTCGGRPNPVALAALCIQPS
jgi:hypothetical protein